VKRVIDEKDSMRELSKSEGVDGLNCIWIKRGDNEKMSQSSDESLFAVKTS
jgi:hypothetical protein